MPPAPWRTGIEAAFRGAKFKVEVGGKAGGRRNVTHEFPERDTPFTEDMGRRARRYPITGYVICSPTNPNYLIGRDALATACDAYGPGTLVHPTLGSMQVNCDTWALSETRERGGIATFQMVFVEAGSLDESGATPDQTAAAVAAAQGLGQAASQGADSAVQSSLAATDGAITA